MDILLNVESVASCQNLRGLRQLHDTIETHIRSLGSLGVPSKSYGSLLSSIVMNTIPHDLRLIISREIRDEEWNLDHLLEMLMRQRPERELTRIPVPAQLYNHPSRHFNRISFTMGNMVLPLPSLPMTQGQHAPIARCLTHLMPVTP